MALSKHLWALFIFFKLAKKLPLSFQNLSSLESILIALSIVLTASLNSPKLANVKAL